MPACILYIISLILILVVDHLIGHEGPGVIMA